MVVLLMALHLMAAALVAVLCRLKVFHLPPAIFPAVFLLPLWGPVFAAVMELHVRGGEKGDEEAGMGRFGITDEVYRNIRMEKEGVEDVLPIEDVLVSGTPVQRRRLLLSVLHTGPESFVKPLRTAGVNDDTEVVHYAVTALVELRSSFSQRIAEMERQLRAHRSDPKILLAGADLDEEYVRSGIPEDAERKERLAHCRNLLERYLQYRTWQEEGPGAGPYSRTKTDGRGGSAQWAADRASLLKRLGRVCLMQEDYAAAEQIGERLTREMPDCEDGYLLVLRARAGARNGEGIAELIGTIRQRNLYLSPQGRREIAFWLPEKDGRRPAQNSLNDVSGGDFRKDRGPALSGML
ncbi:MAG: hypothetical protein Q4D81_00310 [Eubacteriales bacterium]|nr:hypothetical protein [Eubacteriales bacterium]